MTLRRTAGTLLATLALGFGACGDDDATPAPARTISALTPIETDAACGRIAAVAAAPTTCHLSGALASLAWTRREGATVAGVLDAVTGATTDEELRGACSAASERCAQGALPCPLAEFAARGCDVSVERLLQCYDESLTTIEALVEGLPACDALTRADIRAFGMRDLGVRRSCDLVDFECEQTIDLAIEVVAPANGGALPRACQGFEGVCGRCAIRRCRTEIEACCGDPACVAAWSNYDACVATGWNGTIASYSGVRESCRREALAGSAEEMYACREQNAGRECYAQCPVFDSNE